MATLRFLGSGDAFASGGRFQACVLLEGGPAPLMVDCGATSLHAMARAGVDPGSIGHIVVSHLHGDHFGGIPFIVLHGQFNRRQQDLHIAGPVGTGERLVRAMEVLFPGSATATRRFAVHVTELVPGEPAPFGPAVVHAVEADHASGAPSLALRIDYAGRSLAYSGDTAWTDALLDVTSGADLFVCEGYVRERRVPFHLAFETVRENLPRIGCARVVVTHMNAEMLAFTAETAPISGIMFAHDGLVLDL
ncbi:MAG: MBL fold metallo-hydrolase [Dehalococcoidia bacterium]|nr:MBL fold metallo-hydrolase [Dehalococcoidia bacterium]